MHDEIILYIHAHKYPAASYRYTIPKTKNSRNIYAKRVSWYPKSPTTRLFIWKLVQA